MDREGGSPGLMVMRGDSCSEGRGFKSPHCKLDGHFSHLFVVKIVMLFEKTKINEKEAGMAHYLRTGKIERFQKRH